MNAPETATPETEGKITIVTPGPSALAARLAPMVAVAKQYEVTDVDTHATALERAKTLRLGERDITADFEPARKAADDAKKQVLRLRDGYIAPIAEARGIYDRKAADFERVEREKAEKLQRELQEKARREEEERQLMDAVNAEADGDATGAEAILNEQPQVPVVTVAPQVATVSGVTSRELWSAKVDDVIECLLFMTRRPEWRAGLERLKPELESLLRPMAVAQRGSLAIPGVSAVCTTCRSYK